MDFFVLCFRLRILGYFKEKMVVSVEFFFSFLARHLTPIYVVLGSYKMTLAPNTHLVLKVPVAILNGEPPRQRRVRDSIKCESFHSFSSFGAKTGSRLLGKFKSNFGFNFHFLKK